MANSAIQQRAKELGIADAYWDVDGGYHEIDDAILAYFIEALSAPIANDSTSPHFDDVRLLRAGIAESLSFATPIASAKVVDEAGQTVFNQHTKTTTLALPALDSGYYTLTISENNAISDQCIRLIVAPPTCYQPDAFKVRQQRGITLQLYSLRSQTEDTLRANWGIGDFADLRDAISVAADKGLDFVGVNPLHALFPESPDWASPYSPSSRIGFNWLYLAIGDIPEFCDDADNMTWFRENQAQIDALRHADLIDYTAVAQLKRQALSLAFDAFGIDIVDNSDKQARYADFIAFCERGGEALEYNSAFYVMEEFRSEVALDDLGYGDLSQVSSVNVARFIDDYGENIAFYSYLQWLIDEQLNVVQHHAHDCGLTLGLYGDLAVGVAVNSADAWVNPALYALPASVGAPPDPLGPVGQNWSLPPLHPVVLKQQGFQPFIDLLRANMKHFGALRIDHVMGLYRLWLIPEGKDASHGAYIHYPFEALMAILAIESQRAQCLIIGEDLGTVPNEVREALTRYKVLSYDVLYFGGCYDDNGLMRWRKPDAVNREALGVVGTHDLPSLAGWWHCRDLAVLQALNILDEGALKPMYDNRLQDKQALLNALKADGYLPDNYHIDALHMAMHEQLNHAIHAYARNSGTRLFGIQPENFCGVDWAFNVPGTTTETPNWRRKLPCPLTQVPLTLDE